MTLAPMDLSWTALLAAWHRGAFTVGALRDVAVARLADADGDALVPLSELASLPDTASRWEAMPALEALARLHGWPLLLGRQEWQVAQLRVTLATLAATPLWFVDEPWAADHPELEGLERLYALQRVWTALGLDDDGPPLVPPGRAAQYASSLGAEDAPGGEPLEDARQIAWAWIEAQETLLATVSRLWAAGWTAEVQVLAAALERAAEDARGHTVHERAARAEAERRLGRGAAPAHRPHWWTRWGRRD